MKLGKLIGDKLPLKPKDIWAIRISSWEVHAVRNPAMFNLAVDSKFRGFDLVSQVLLRRCTRRKMFRLRAGECVVVHAG